MLARCSADDCAHFFRGPRKRNTDRAGRPAQPRPSEVEHEMPWPVLRSSLRRCRVVRAYNDPEDAIPRSDAPRAFQHAQVVEERLELARQHGVTPRMLTRRRDRAHAWFSGRSRNGSTGAPRRLAHSRPYDIVHRTRSLALTHDPQRWPAAEARNELDNGICTPDDPNASQPVQLAGERTASARHYAGTSRVLTRCRGGGARHLLGRQDDMRSAQDMNVDGRTHLYLTPLRPSLYTKGRISFPACTYVNRHTAREAEPALVARRTRSIDARRERSASENGQRERRLARRYDPLTR